MDESIASLKGQGMPVFSVGVGRDRLGHDVQVTRAETPRRALKGSNLVVDVVVSQTGYAGAKVPLIVEDAGRMVSTQEITLPSDGEAKTIKVRFLASETGPRQFRFKIPVQGNEEVPQNNQRESMVEVYDRNERILYLEGEPRYETKFIEQAAKQGVPVNILAVGTEQGPSNVRLAELEASAAVFVKEPIKLAAVIESQGLQGQPANVYLRIRIFHPVTKAELVLPPLPIVAPAANACSLRASSKTLRSTTTASMRSGVYSNVCPKGE